MTLLSFLTTPGRSLCWLFLFLLVSNAGCGIAREKPLADDENESRKEVDRSQIKKFPTGTHTDTWQLGDGSYIGYALNISATYSDDRPTPLVVLLHPEPNQVSAFQQSMGRVIVEATADLDPLIVMPTLIKGSWANETCQESVMSLLRELCKTYNIDRQRVLILGYGIGGEGSWQFAGKHPDFFTAAIPMSGRPPGDYASTDWTVPMLIIHSRDDELFPFQVVADAVSALESQGNTTVQLYPLDGISHFNYPLFAEPLKEAVRWVSQVWQAKAGSPAGQ